MNGMFNLFNGMSQQPLQLGNGYQRNTLDFSRPLSSFSGGYNQQMQPLSSATQEPVGGFMPYTAPAMQPMEDARQMAPSLLTQAPEQGGQSSGINDGMSAQGAQAKAEQMASQGSPMLSQVPQIGGRYQRKFQGLLG